MTIRCLCRLGRSSGDQVPTRRYLGAVEYRAGHVHPSESSSVLAAMMKSFWCRPPILCVHQVTVTFPHSVNSAGWCPSSSACSPTLLVKVSAWAKLRNLNTRSRRSMHSRWTTCHSGTCGSSSAISAWVSVGSPPRQAVHFISESSLMFSSFLWACRLSAKSILRRDALVPQAIQEQVDNFRTPNLVHEPTS